MMLLWKKWSEIVRWREMKNVYTTFMHIMCQMTDYNCYFISSVAEQNKEKATRNFRRKAVKKQNLL